MSKRKDKILHTRLTEEDYNRLKKEAEKNYISVSSLVRIAVMKYLS